MNRRTGTHTHDDCHQKGQHDSSPTHQAATAGGAKTANGLDMQTVLPQALLASAAYIWVFTLSSLHNCTLHMPDTAAAAAATVASPWVPHTVVHPLGGARMPLAPHTLRCSRCAAGLIWTSRLNAHKHPQNPSKVHACELHSKSRTSSARGLQLVHRDQKHGRSKYAHAAPAPSPHLLQGCKVWVDAHTW